MGLLGSSLFGTGGRCGTRPKVKVPRGASLVIIKCVRCKSGYGRYLKSEILLAVNANTEVLQSSVACVQRPGPLCMFSYTDEGNNAKSFPKLKQGSDAFPAQRVAGKACLALAVTLVGRSLWKEGPSQRLPAVGGVQSRPCFPEGKREGFGQGCRSFFPCRGGMIYRCTFEDDYNIIFVCNRRESTQRKESLQRNDLVMVHCIGKQRREACEACETTGCRLPAR